MRNHDEIRLWADYVGCGRPESGTYLVDDAGVAGGLAPGGRLAGTTTPTCMWHLWAAAGPEYDVPWTPDCFLAPCNC